MAEVEVIKFDGANGSFSWSVYLVGEIDPEKGLGSLSGEQSFSNVLKATRLIVKDKDKDKDKDKPEIELQFANTIEIPVGFIKDPKDPKGPKYRIRTIEEINQEINGESYKNKVLYHLAETNRRLRNIEVNGEDEKTEFLGIKSPIVKGAVFVGSIVKFNLWSTKNEEQKNTTKNGEQNGFQPSFEAIAYADIEVAGNKGFVGFACVLASAGDATLRIDLDDLNISLPPFKLPSLNLRFFNNPLDLSGPMDAALAGTFPRLVTLDEAKNIKTTFSQTNGDNAKLALRMSANQIDWAVVVKEFDSSNADDWKKDNLSKKLAAFNARIIQTSGDSSEIKVISEIAVINDLKFACTSEIKHFDVGEIKVENALKVKDGKKLLGPLDINWEGLKVTASANLEKNHHTLWSDVSFKRLVLRVRDDPDAVLAFSGQVRIAPNRIEIVKLRLLEPYPIELIAQALESTARTAEPIFKLLFHYRTLFKKGVAYFTTLIIIEYFDNY